MYLSAKIEKKSERVMEALVGGEDLGP